MAEEVVRRSTPIEYLERIINSTDPADTQLMDWAGEELPKVKVGFYDDEIGLGVPKEANRRYGLLRPAVNLSVDRPEIFVQLVVDAYKDARGYPEYIGIIVKAGVEQVSSGSGSTTCEFNAGLGERVGLVDTKVYRTELSFTYQHPQEELFDEAAETREQLESIMTLIKPLVELEEKEAIQISGDSLIIGQTKAEENN